ncbi:MAG: 16S rRNA (cytosine(967)-C(5))-methyltransferase RsmB [Thermodesulfovibrionales bacterium]
MDINRYNALNILIEILINGKKTKDAMSHIDASGAREIDRAFVMELVYGCVRYKLLLEWTLRKFLKDFSGTKKNTVLNLMMAVYQVKQMRVPDFAAVNEAVDIEKKMKGIPSLVNAVLRKFIKNKENLKLPSLSEKPALHISLATSHPEWLVRKWSKRLKTDDLLKFAIANNEIPPLSIRINSLLSNVHEIKEIMNNRDIHFAISQYCPVGMILKDTSIHSIADILGPVFVQDEASQVISYLLDPKPEEYILDACAAPGGKSTHIAQITKNRSRIVAVDNSIERLTVLKENIRTSGASSIEPVESDILEFTSDKHFDRILLDAPCSALGVIRRNPDVKYRHTEADFKRLNERQLHMLLHVSELLKTHGILIYSVCSTEPEETVDVIKEFLNIKRDFYIINNLDDIDIGKTYKENIGWLLTEEGYLLTYPHIHNMDGFFAVRLGRK